uniref:EOG090X07E6 n=1 Tax=Daphnia magna TaxID=35525 RepID=A0A4Y7MJG7_9CRUS|nr:EOG090X07E6 [Daphnia magna]SVE81358.1 EOG090X07E6 [Daphnia magna]SVE83111.1 EOG090X07E6 [Daphnia magna]
MAQLSSSPYALIVGAPKQNNNSEFGNGASPLLQGLRLSCQAYPPSTIIHFSSHHFSNTSLGVNKPCVNCGIFLTDGAGINLSFCFRFVFIHIYTSLTTVHLKHILDLVSHTMVFYLGLEELVNVKNIERLKKDLKVCYPLIDTILDGLNPKEDLEEFCDLTDYTDVLSCSERSTFEGILNCFAESVGTVFGCLRVRSKVAAATPNWWTLDSVELLQIQLLLSNERYDTGIDIPIYLPVRSPKIPFRLVQWKLTQNSDVCLLCGPTPSLADLEKEVKRFWRTAFALLKSAESCYPANIPLDITLDKNVLSYLVMNTEKRRSLSSLSPHTTSGDVHSHLTSVRKRDILRTFYKTIVGTMIDLPGPTQTVSKEVFMNFEYYSLHALISDVYLILVLYPSGLHNHYLRSITRTTLKILTHEKNCKW